MGTLPLLARSGPLAIIQEAVDAVGRGEVVAISIIGDPGTGRTRLLDEAARILDERQVTVHRVAAFQATRTTPRETADRLSLPFDGSGPVALLVDDAQWIDATSLALIRAALANAGQGLMVLLAHSPIGGFERFAFESLAETSRRVGTYREIVLGRLTVDDLDPLVGGGRAGELAAFMIEASGGLPGALSEVVGRSVDEGTLRWEDGVLVMAGLHMPAQRRMGDRLAGLDATSRHLAELCAVAGRPVPVRVAAQALDVSAREVLEIGEGLGRQGFIQETPEGFAAVGSRVAEELGTTRRAFLSGELADAEMALGISDREPGIVGQHFLAAARWADAVPLLARAGLELAGRQHLAEAYPLIDGALDAYEQANLRDPDLEGRLRLGRATCFRLAGWSGRAAEDLDLAIALLAGEDRIAALGYAAQVADDRQRPQEGEWMLAEGMLEALIAGRRGSLGSLLTLHARTLARIGFSREADAELAKGLSVLAADGSAAQRHWGRYNAAWVAFDRGRARDAEALFSQLVDEAEQIGGQALLADREAWWARALFMAGRPDAALEARERSIEHADMGAGPVFLAHMALAEGAIRFGAWETAFDAADETLAIVLHQLPAWENSARYLRARALQGAGWVDEAAEEAVRALAVCPDGVNGRRWWVKIRVLQLELAADSGADWPATEALDLTDELLQSEWYLSAVRLMTIRATAEKDPSLAKEAMALADQLGVAGPAAEAAHAGSLWNTPEAAAVIASVKATAGHVPEAWRQGWEAQASIAAALSAPEVDDQAYEEASRRLAESLDQAFEEAGLGPAERLISPAQRRARGLVRRRKRPFRWTPLRIAAAVIGVVILGSGAGLAGGLFGGGTTVISQVIQQPATPAQPTTTRPLEIWETELGPPGKDVVVGQWSFGGDTEDEDQLALNTGASGRAGVWSADGYYWKYAAAGKVDSSPAVLGEIVIFGSDDGGVYSIAMPSGAPPLWIDDSSSAGIEGSPVLGAHSSGSSLVPTSGVRVYWASKDGVLRIRSDARKQTAQVFRFPADGALAGQVEASPLVLHGSIYVATTGGVLYAVDASEPFDERWSVDLGSPIRATPAAADGILYVGTENGVLWAVDEETGQKRACFESGDTIVSPPVIAEDTVLIPARDAQTLYAVEKGSCRLQAGILLSAPVTSSPAYADGMVYVAVGNFVEVWDLEARELAWQFPGVEQVGALAGRAGWPAVGDGVLYFTSEEPYLYAVDITTHKELWRFKLDSRVVNRPAIMDGAVVVADRSGMVWAIGCTDPPACGR